MVIVQEEPDESDEILKTKFIDEIFCDKLGIKCESVGRTRRLGRETGKRPVIVFFQDYNEKMEVFKNVSKLKGTDFCAKRLLSKNTENAKTAMGLFES